MDSNIETAVQWIYNHIRYVMRAKHGRARTKVGKERQSAALEAEWVGMCWDIGHSLVMMQAHGIAVAPVIESVSKRLQTEFPESGDLGGAGLLRMRQFYLDYFERPHLLPKLMKIAWACHLLIQERCRDPLQQEFFLELCARKKMAREDLAKAMDERAYELNAAPAAEAAPLEASALSGSDSTVSGELGAVPFQGS
jgi:hypothetical protein